MLNKSACVPVVETLIEELQQASVIHIDETPWYEKGKFCWLWVAITTGIPHFKMSHINASKNVTNSG
ncbi:MAG: IS66 family transposase [Nostochopsis sp.]